jgi:CRP-like cAMP-binding protein
MADFSEIKKILLKYNACNESQIALFTNKLQEKKLKKREFVTQPSQVADCIYFIKRGSFRFYTKADDTEQTITFFTENSWMTDLESLLKQEPSYHYIEACEVAEVSFITLKDIHELIQVEPKFQMLNSLLIDLIIPTNHLTRINTKSPDERYKTLLSKNPEWINRFPQMHIASYLGITPETLSRVRARLQ